MWPTGSSRPRRAATSWPTRPVTSATPATCSPVLPTPTSRCCWWTLAPACCARPAGTRASRNCLASSTSSRPSTRSTSSTSIRAGSPRSKRSCAQMAARLGGAELTVIPIAAKHGDNVVHRSDRTPWYNGPTLLEYLEGVELSAPQPEAAKLRLPIQWVSRPTADERRRYTGRLAAGTLQRRRPGHVASRGHPIDGHRRRHARRRPHHGRCAAVGLDRARRRHRRRPRRRARQRRRRTPRCRYWPANSTRRCAGSPRRRCGPATGSRSNRARQDGPGDGAGAALPAGSRDARRARRPG